MRSLASILLFVIACVCVLAYSDWSKAHRASQERQSVLDACTPPRTQVGCLTVAASNKAQSAIRDIAAQAQAQQARTKSEASATASILKVDESTGAQVNERGMNLLLVMALSAVTAGMIAVLFSLLRNIGGRRRL